MGASSLYLEMGQTTKIDLILISQVIDKETRISRPLE